jgi:hypothetical protein
LYDHRILQFVLAHEYDINGFRKPRRQVTAEFHSFRRLLEIWFDLVTALEGSACRLANAYALITYATSQLAAIADESEDSRISATYRKAIQFITQYTIDSSFDILQLAYVLTPAGRQEAFDQLKSVEGLEAHGREPFSLEMVDFADQLAAHDIEDDLDGVGDEDLEGTVEVALDPGAGPETEISDENASEVFLLEVPAADWPSDYLAHRALAGLRQIIQQFGLDENEKDRLEAAFHEFIESSASSGVVKTTFDGTRYLWLSAPIDHPRYSLLAEIARRLEPAICSEAPANERSDNNDVFWPHTGQEPSRIYCRRVPQWRTTNTSRGRTESVNDDPFTESFNLEHPVFIENFSKHSVFNTVLKTVFSLLSANLTLLNSVS